MRKQLTYVLCLLSSVLAVTAGAAKPNFELGAHIFKCAVYNPEGRLATESDGYTLVIQKTSGDELRRGSVGDPDENGINCSIDINLSSEGSPTTAKPGEQVTFALYEGAGLAAVSNFPVTVGNAADVSYVRLLTVTYDRFESKYFGDKDGYVYLPHDYVERVCDEAEEYKPVYEPDEDWDGDGSLNYAEFVAGTDPNWADDVLKIIAYDGAEPISMLSFTYHKSRTYTVLATDSLTNGTTWARVKFRTTTEGPDQESVIYPGEDDGKVKWTSIYLERPQALKKFYRIGVQ